MSDKPISPLRQRMIDDMTARRFTEDTQRDYVRNVRMFAAFLGRSPDTATKEDFRRFQLHMAKQQIRPGSINAAIAALRFFFTVTLERPDLVLPLRTRSIRSPPVSSTANIDALFEQMGGEAVPLRISEQLCSVADYHRNSADVRPILADKFHGATQGERAIASSRGI